MHERARGHLLPHFETDMMDTAITSAQGPVSLAVSISPKIWPMTVHIMHCFFMPHDMLELLVTLDWRQDGLGRALNGAAHGGAFFLGGSLAELVLQRGELAFLILWSFLYSSVCIPFMHLNSLTGSSDGP